MKQITVFALGVVLLSGCATAPVKHEAATTGGGLVVPESAPARGYLGLEGPAGRVFSLDEIQAEVLVIDTFDMYCHNCQWQAPRSAALEAALKPNMRLIGLGVGNTPMETQAFAAKFGLRFPCFSDRSRAIAGRFGKPRLPGLMVLKKEGGTFRLVRMLSYLPTDPNEVLGGL